MYTETNSREKDFVLKRNMKKIYNTLMAISDINHNASEWYQKWHPISTCDSV